MQNKKKLLILICAIIFIILIYEIIHIYAVFYSKMEANVQLKNGTWNINVNGTQISKGVDATFVIDKISTSQNEHVENNKLAPGLSGSFNIKINPENTDVSIIYDITLNEEKLTNSSLQIKTIKETEVGNTLTQTGENTYTGVILLEDIKKGTTNTIEMEVEWIDDENNNEEDTKLGSTYDSKLSIPVKVHVSQYLGEEINPWTQD